MPLKTLVKVSGVTNLGDARYCAGMGVDLLGFNVIRGQARYMEPGLFQEIRGWIAGPLVVANIQGMKSASELSSIVDSYAPALLEVSEVEIPMVTEVDLPLILRCPSTTLRPDTRVRYVQVPSAQVRLEALANLLCEVDSLTTVQKLFATGPVPGIAVDAASAELAEILEFLDM